MITSFLSTIPFFQAAPLNFELTLGAIILGLLPAIVLHELAHGVAALKLGDPTAQLAGRITLNPIKHVDLWGTILVPLVLSILPGGLIFGWAKPVPVNYYNLRGGKYGPVVVALAGPLMNLLLLIIFGLAARVALATPYASTYLPNLFGVVALINGFLMMFNLIPVPPLDGSKVLYIFLERRPDIISFLEQYGFVIFLILIFFGGGVISFFISPAFYLTDLVAGRDAFIRALEVLGGG